jgi:diguanylate cyclase (GGDEF)-like protein/PAS domain S-box-containing protein
MHPRLRRQLSARAGGDAPSPEEWKAFVGAVEQTYQRSDEERALLQESLRAMTALWQQAQDEQAGEIERKEARRARGQRAAKRLARKLVKSEICLLAVGPDLIVHSATHAAARLCGVAPEATAGAHMFSLLAPMEKDAVAALWRTRLSEGEPVVQTMACTAKDGRTLACDWVCIPRLRRDGKLATVAVLIRDQTAKVEAQEALRRREERTELAIAGAGDAVWDWDLGRNQLFLTPQGAAHLGITGKPSGAPADWLDRVHADDLPSLRIAFDAHLAGGNGQFEHEHRVRDASGDWKWISVRGAVVRDAAGAAVRIVGLLSDVTRHRQLIERMAHDARHDPLTGLPNRVLFLDLLRHSFHRIRRHPNYRFAVLFIDIDRFKTVNDAYGHQVGDQLLVQIARRLESCLREGDTLARHAGDEFTMWLDDIHGPGDATRVADRVHEVMRKPFDLGGQEVHSSTSIGVAIGSSKYAQAEEVLRDADAAMYRAKAEGTARTTFFQLPTSDSVPPRVQLETDLRDALMRDELRVHYMPIVAVPTGKVEGFEALARWQHPRLGLVAPAHFMALAVETGLIVPIDRWVLQTASRQLHDWRRQIRAATGLTLSVNLSLKLLEQWDVALHIDRVLRDAELLPSDLNVDISESALALGRAPEGLLADLRHRGLGLHMDDFGTGQAWLRHLHATELASVKIDRSFVTALSTPAGDRKVLHSIVAIAREQGKKVIAEGVETAEQLHYVREAGCDSAQGFFFSTPLDGIRAGTLLQRGGMFTRRD